jgi:SAM-dependent methyltransferase
LQKVLDLGKQPLANAFLKEANLKKEKQYPLCVMRCTNSACGFLQLRHVVDPDTLFGDYVYVSSTSPVFVQHFEEYAASMNKRLGLSGAFTLDIGSNDGVLVKPLKELGAKALGIDPARAIAKKATAEGFETIVGYFDEKFAQDLAKKRGKAKLITANNVFAHIDDLAEVVRGVRALLSKDGLFVIEAQYVVDFLEKNLFDMTYHEHVSYLGVRPLQAFFKKFGLQIVDVEHVDTHGGSVRIMVAHDDSAFKEQSIVKKMIRDEEKRVVPLCKKFAKAVVANKKVLRTMLAKFKQQGKKIAAYGAPAKGNTLLNYMQLGRESLEYIVEDNPLKLGLVSPGMHIPVVSNSVLKTSPPDYLLILAWNFAQPIIEKNKEFASRGGKFIVPMPKPTIV